MSYTSSDIFNRSALLLGTDVMSRISNTRVIILGVGGVGSWCAECLVRNGIGHLTIVDSDTVHISNCNRQLMATTKTVGMSKVHVLRDRLLDINPEADILPLQTLFSEESALDFHLEQYDYIVDCIDSLQDKAFLINYACRLSHENRNITFLSSMGAALRIDPTMVRVAEFWKVKGDALARALRNRFKRSKQFPECKFLCVYSEEPPMENKLIGELSEGDVAHHKVQANGSLSHITAIFGFTLAGLVVKDINGKDE